VTADLLQYGKHTPIPAGTQCHLCPEIPRIPKTDHCHQHGWVRGVVCSRCNWLMSVIDKGILPDLGDSKLDTVTAYAARCPECPPRTDDTMKPIARYGLGVKVSAGTLLKLRDVRADLLAGFRGTVSHDKVIAAMTEVARNHRDEMLSLLR
jgi:hypothetical protein